MNFTLLKILSLLLSGILSLTGVFWQGRIERRQDISWQKAHIEAIEREYANGTRKAVDEGSFFEGDLQLELESGMKFNELQAISSHNSYKRPSVSDMKELYKVVSKVTDGKVVAKSGAYDAHPLIDQLDAGIRSFELDVEANKDGTFTCMHLPIFDMTTYCYDFALALKEIALWSKVNENHLPISIVIEVKNKMLPLQSMVEFDIDQMPKFEQTLKNVLGDKLVTPADMLGDFEDFEDLRQNNAWPLLKDMLGKVIVILHPDDSLTQEYINQDLTFRKQVMFPMVKFEYDKVLTPNAGFLMINWVGTAEYERNLYSESQYIVRTRADSFGNVYYPARDMALRSQAQIISTGYAPPNIDNVFTFDGGKTLRRSK